jgi:hypothetical protein
MIGKFTLSFPNDFVIPLKILKRPGIKQVSEHIIIDIANNQIANIKYNPNNNANENISIRINNGPPNDDNNNPNNQKTSRQDDFRINL